MHNRIMFFVHVDALHPFQHFFSYVFYWDEPAVLCRGRDFTKFWDSQQTLPGNWTNSLVFSIN